MKSEVIYAMNGQPVTRLTPENAEDEAKLYRMIESGELDARESFGDDPEVWEQWRKERKGIEPPRKKYVIENGVMRLVPAD